MTEVRTRDEAIALVHRAFAGWARTTTGILEQASSVAAGARTDAERVVSRRRLRVSALEAALESAPEEDLPRLQSEFVRARAALDQARRASVRITDVAAGVDQMRRSHATFGLPQAATACSQLAAMSRAIEDYRGTTIQPSSGPTRSPANPGPTSAVARFGLCDLEVGAADLADTPIQAEFGRGGATRADYRWAVQTWTDTIGPGIAKGMTRDDFAARDQRTGARPLRRQADAYDLFLGSERIRVDRRPDGTLNIVNGRHRLQIARDLGIKFLPGEVT